MRRLVFCLCMTSFLLLGSDAFFLSKWGMKMAPLGKEKEEEKHSCDENKDKTCEEQNYKYEGEEKLYEGDIALGPSKSLISITEDAHVQREFWGDIMYYRYDRDMEKKYRDLIGAAISRFDGYVNNHGGKKCVQFKDVTDEIPPSNYVNIRVDTGCFSNIGMLGGEQIMAFTESLLERGVQSPDSVFGTICHELMHSLGFYHEQNRQDRDAHVNLHRERILKGYEKNFNKLQFDSFNLKYNFLSIMHYSLYAFTNDGTKTMTVKHPQSKPVNEEEIGQRKNITDLDIMNVRMAYCN